MWEVISGIVLALHLVCMNVAAAGPLLCVWLDYRGARSDGDSQAAARYLANTCLNLLLVGGLLGMAQGWLHWNAAYRELLSRFAPRITWGIVEFGFSAVLLAAYAGWMTLRPVVGRPVYVARTMLAVLAATNLLYHFPPLFSMLAGAAAGQLEIGHVVNSAEFRRLLGRGDVLALAVHFIIASFAVSGTLLLAFGAGLVGRPAADRPRIAIGGGRIALVTTLLQLPVGVWLIVQLPANAQRRMMGEDPWSAALLIAALLTSFWLLHQLAAAAFGEVSRASARRTIVAMSTVVLLMAGVLQRAQLRHETNDARGDVHVGSMRHVAGS